MADSIELVGEFRRKLGLPIGTGSNMVKHDLEFHRLMALRASLVSSEYAVKRSESSVGKQLRFLMEESREVVNAVLEDDKGNLLKELCDVQYILDGLFHIFGYQDIKEEAFRRVHASNMSKSTIDATGKVEKGPDYIEPNFQDLLDSLGKP